MSINLNVMAKCLVVTTFTQFTAPDRQNKSQLPAKNQKLCGGEHWILQIDCKLWICLFIFTFIFSFRYTKDFLENIYFVNKLLWNHLFYKQFIMSCWTTFLLKAFLFQILVQKASWNNKCLWRLIKCCCCVISSLVLVVQIKSWCWH